MKPYNQLLPLIITVLLGLFSFLLSCELIEDTNDMDDDDDDDDVELTGWSPSEVNRGSQVKFYGSHLDKVTSVVFQSQIEVTAFVSQESTELVVTVPQGAVTGKVTLKFSGGQVATSSNLRILIPDPKVTFSRSILDFGASQVSVELTMENTGGHDFEWDFDDWEAAWLQVSPQEGVLPVRETSIIRFQVDRTKSSFGIINNKKITWRGTANGRTYTFEIDVRMERPYLDSDADGLIDIHTVNDLYAIRDNLTATGVGSQEGTLMGYELMNNLDFEATSSYSDAQLKATLTAGEGWIPIGTSGVSNHFNAVFEGNGFTIKNLYHNRPDRDYQGLFGVIGEAGVVRNLTIEVKAFNGKNDVGALAGLLYRGEVTNCHVQGTLSGNYDMGLLIGYNQGGTIAYCTTTGAVVSRSYSAGGLVGANYSYSNSDGTSVIKNSWANVIMRGGENLGGLIGYNASGDEVISCYAIGEVISTTSQGGGLVGENAGGTITASYARGNVSSTSNELGGLVGRNSGTVVTSYATGKVNGSGTTYNGGLIGYNTGTVTATNYWDVTTSGLTTSGGSAIGLTTLELQAPTSASGIYITWNEDAWDFGTSSQYPVLKGMPGGVEKQRE